MITKRFQNRVAESRIALPITGVYAFVVCSVGGLFAEQLWVQFALLALSSFLMMELNNTNALIRIYSRMVSCSFLALAVMSHFLFTDICCGIVQVCFIAFYLFFFSAYQNKGAVGRIFYAFMMLGIASVLFPQILYFVPVTYILMFTNLMVGNFRMTLAALMGLIAPYWFVLAYCLLNAQMAEFIEHFETLIQFDTFERWTEMPLSQIMTIIYVAILSVVGILHFRLNNYKDKIRTRMIFESFSVMSIITMVFILLFPQFVHFGLALLIVSAAPMIGHYIALTNSFLSNISFYVMIVLTLVFTICNIWYPF